MLEAFGASGIPPDVFDPVVRRANRYDSVIHGTHQNAKKMHCKRGHEFTPENTAPNHGNGRRCRACRRITERKAVA